MCFVSPSSSLQILKRLQSHNNKKQPPPLPTKAIANNHTPTQHITALNQQKMAAFAGNKMWWIQPLLR